MRRRARVLAAVVTLLGALSGPLPLPAAAHSTTATTAPPSAARQKQIDAEITTLRQQVAEASEDEAQALDRLDEAAGRRRALETRIAALDGEIAAAEAALAEATAALGAVEGDLRRAETKLAATEAGLQAARDTLRDRAVDAYVRQPGPAVAIAFVNRQSFRELAAATDFLSAVVDAHQRAVDRYRALRDGIERDRAQLAQARETATVQRDDVAQHREVLVRARAEQDSLRRRVADEERSQAALVKDLRQRVKEFEAQIAALKKESDAIASLLRRRQTGQVRTPSGKGVLAVPVDAAITSAFGPRRHPILGTTRMHNGIDFAATAGTPIKAAADGVVLVAGVRGGYGNTVIVDHGGALATLYAHQSRLAVAEGSAVRRGQVVGYVGSTGLSTGPHLHFEVRVNGNPVDPMRYL